MIIKNIFLKWTLYLNLIGSSILFVDKFSFAQDSADYLVGSTFLDFIVIDVESNMEIPFDSGNDYKGIDRVDAEEIGGDAEKKAGLLRITGASVETMVSIEREMLLGKDKQNNEIFTIYDFDIYQNEAGSSVTILPLSQDASYVMGIGGKIKGKPDDNETYQGINIVNVNYL